MSGDTCYYHSKYEDMPVIPDWYNESSNVSGFTSAFETNSEVGCVQGAIFACLNEHMFHRGKQVLQFLFGSETQNKGDVFTNTELRSLFGI
jgi:hypothetical protein